MDNSERTIVEQLIALYGIEKTISFCEMNVFVYGKMYEEICQRTMDNQELIYEYDYQHWRWQQTLNELTGREIEDESRTI